jgi:hypothetical protein
MPFDARLLLSIVGVATCIFFAGRIARVIAEALNNFRGPGPPTHPLPANDTFLTLRRRSKRTAGGIE